MSSRGSIQRLLSSIRDLYTLFKPARTPTSPAATLFLPAYFALFSSSFHIPVQLQQVALFIYPGLFIPMSFHPTLDVPLNVPQHAWKFTFAVARFDRARQGGRRLLLSITLLVSMHGSSAISYEMPFAPPSVPHLSTYPSPIKLSFTHQVFQV